MCVTKDRSSSTRRNSIQHKSKKWGRRLKIVMWLTSSKTLAWWSQNRRSRINTFIHEDVDVLLSLNVALKYHVRAIAHIFDSFDYFVCFGRNAANYASLYAMSKVSEYSTSIPTDCEGCRRFLLRCHHHLVATSSTQLPRKSYSNIHGVDTITYTNFHRNNNTIYR